MLPTRYITTTAVMCAAFMAAALPAHAQERAAGSALETQMTWSTLKNLVDDANAKTSAVDSRLNVVSDSLKNVKGRVDKIEKCNVKGMIYSPGNGADEDDCITPTATVQTDYLRRYVDESITCVQKGGDFQSSAGGSPAIPPVGWKPTVPTGTCKVVNVGDVSQLKCEMKTKSVSNGFASHTGCKNAQPCPDGYQVFPGTGGGGGGDRTGQGCGSKTCVKIVCK